RDGEVDVRRDDLAGQPDLLARRVPAKVHSSAGGADGGLLLADRRREVLDDLERLAAAEAAATGDDDRGVLELEAFGDHLLAAGHARAALAGRGQGDDIGRAGARARLERLGADGGDG